MTSRITIHTLWGLRKGTDFPELMEAWDEFCVDENWDGWKEACDRSIASWGNDIVAHRFVNVTVDEAAINAAFETKSVPGEVRAALGEDKP